jgi:hypothetical protein
MTMPTIEKSDQQNEREKLEALYEAAGKKFRLKSWDGEKAVYLVGDFNDDTIEVSFSEETFIFNPKTRKFYKVVE